MSESYLQRNIRRALEQQRGGCFFKQHGSEYSIVGCPDLLGTVRGYFFAFEVKKGNKEPTEAQWHEIDRIRASGGFAFYVTSVDQALGYVDACLEEMGCSLDSPPRSATSKKKPKPFPVTKIR